MSAPIRLSQAAQRALRCPVCHARLAVSAAQLECENPEHRFPIIDGVPVVLNEAASIFSIADYLPREPAPAGKPPEGRLKSLLRHLAPTMGENLKGPQNYRRFIDLLLQQTSSPRVLVLGGKIVGDGMEVVIHHPALDLVETDVGIGPRTAMICDAHDIPFDDASFDGVIVQAVLEHVVDPYRCVAEIHRVLNSRGVVYAETPFMQQVHAGRFDFTRFTHLGHRRLFRHFEEIESGASCGPGMALAWSYKYFLTSFTTSKTAGLAAAMAAGMTSFYLKYFDAMLIDKPGTLDAASGLYFLGKKSDKVLSDRELITLYKGINRTGG